MRKPDGTYRTHEEMVAEGIPTRYQGASIVPRECAHLDPNTTEGEAFPETMYVVWMSEVEVDVATGRTKVLALKAASDVGTIGNLQGVEGQAYGGAAQAAYPWRGRITCHPAPGRPGTVDGTGTATAQVDANNVAEMAALIAKHREPYAAKLEEPLAITETLLYRRGNFNGTFDQLIVDALMREKDAPIAFSPGFRWGTTLLPGQPIRREHLMDQTAISYPFVTVNEMKGETIRTILEDVADNLFNPDPYYQQGGDMVRVGGLGYTMTPAAAMGSRISDLRLGGKPLDADKTYKVAGWAPVSEEAKNAGTPPIWDLVEPWLKAKGTVSPRQLNVPNLVGVQGNAGFVA